MCWAVQILACLFSSVMVDRATAQVPGDNIPSDVNPPHITIQQCSAGGECTPKVTGVTLDLNWRWIHKLNGSSSCLQDDGFWDNVTCPDGKTCAKKCAVEGVPAGDYQDAYGISVTANGTGLKLQYGPAGRIYLLDDDKYAMFKLRNKEFSFDIDVSTLPCGINAAIYLIEMDENGGSSDAGAALGAGYCDAQCPQDAKFINGEANVGYWQHGWTQNPEYEWTKTAPHGRYGACCAEFDLFEGGRAATAFTAHPCSIAGLQKCAGTRECGNLTTGELGFCDKVGCGHNSYQLGERDFYGADKSFKVDTSKPFTVVTQFVTHDGSDDGDLVEIKRYWVQDGKTIDNSKAVIIDELNQTNSMTEEFCNMSSSPGFEASGGLEAMGEPLGRGMVLALSIWDDPVSRMLWLDGEKSLIDQDPKDPGVPHGPCEFSSGLAEQVQKDNPEAYVTYSNIKVGPLGSTFSKGVASATSDTTTVTVSARAGADATTKEPPALEGESLTASSTPSAGTVVPLDGGIPGDLPEPIDCDWIPEDNCSLNNEIACACRERNPWGPCTQCPYPAQKDPSQFESWPLSPEPIDCEWIPEDNCSFNNEIACACREKNPWGPCTECPDPQRKSSPLDSPSPSTEPPIATQGKLSCGEEITEACITAYHDAFVANEPEAFCDVCQPESHMWRSCSLCCDMCPSVHGGASTAIVRDFQLSPSAAAAFRGSGPNASSALLLGGWGVAVAALAATALAASVRRTRRAHGTPQLVTMDEEAADVLIIE